MYWSQEVAKIRSLQQGFDINKTLATTENEDLTLMHDLDVDLKTKVLSNPYIESKPSTATNTKSKTGYTDTASSTSNVGGSKQKRVSAAGGRSKSKGPPNDNPFDFDHSDDEEGSKLVLLNLILLLI